jgi:hypothetical protein
MRFICCILLVFMISGDAGAGLPDMNESALGRSLREVLPSVPSKLITMPDDIMVREIDTSLELTPDELVKVRKLLEKRVATAKDVAWVNVAVKGTALVMALCIGLIFLVVLRYVFNRWFDEDVYTQAWPSVAVIAAMLAFMAVVLYGAVS